MNVGDLASPYVSPYLYESKKRSLDTVYGIRRDGDVFMIGDSQVGVDRDGNIHINNVKFPATKGLWELLTRKRVDKHSFTTADIKHNSTILEITNAHLEGYSPVLTSALPKVSSIRRLLRSFTQAAPDRAASMLHYVASG